MVPKVVDEEVDTQDRSVVDHFEPVPWNYNVNPLKTNVREQFSADFKIPLKAR